MSTQRFTGTEQYVATDDLSTPRRCASRARWWVNACFR
jgi:hypothetical protein